MTCCMIFNTASEKKGHVILSLPCCSRTVLLEMQIVLWVSYEEILNKKQKVRETAYNTPVHPQLEYAAPIWDPYTKEKTLQLEKVQRRASH